MRRALIVPLFVFTGFAIACASRDDDTPPPATGTVGFLMACTRNEDCESGLCFHYNRVGASMLCSKTCAMASDCPAPSSGCNNMGVCKDAQ